MKKLHPIHQNILKEISQMKSISTPENISFGQRYIGTDKPYHGFTTKVVASSIKEFNDEKATVLVDAQVNEETLTENKVYYKSGRVELVRVEADWKVDGLYWDK
jgi:hypothetical protein